MKIFNRQARRDYELFERLEAGLSLSGPETKSAREGKINLDEAYVRLRGGQAYLINAHIHPYRFASPPAGGFDPRRTRKLLLHKKEILALEQKAKQKKLTIIPVSCYTTSSKRGVQGSGRRPGSYNKRGLVKLEIALARGKREYEHREEIKRRDSERDLEQELAS